MPEQTSYEEFLTGDAEDREGAIGDALLEAERAALLEEKRSRRGDEKPHLPGEWP